MSRVRARAGLREMRRESECWHGRGLKRSWCVGRATCPRIPVTCASARSLVHGGRGDGGANREGPRRRERRGAWGNGSVSGKTDPQGRGKKGAGGSNWRRQVGPTG